MPNSLTEPERKCSIPFFPVNVFLNIFRRSALSALLLAVMVSAHARASDPNCAPNANLPPPELQQPRNIDGLKGELLYYKCSGAYDRDFSQVIDQAISWVLKRAKESGKLALVLDIDETSLSNWDEIVANDFGFVSNGPCNLPTGPCGDDVWKRLASLKSLDTLRLFKIAKANNVAVFFVTGRREDLREATTTNLREAGYSDWADLMLRPSDDKSTVQQFKTSRRKEITALGYTIIANVGDQYSDLRGGYAEQVFKLPNPFYFIP